MSEDRSSPIRSLLVTRTLPRSGGGGVEMRTQQVLDALARLGPVGVFALRGEPAFDPPISGVALWRSSSVERLTDSGGSGGSGGSDGRWLADPGGHPSDDWYSPVAADELRTAVDEFGPDVVVLDHLWLHRYISALAPSGVRVVLNAHNVEGPLYEALARRGSGPLASMLRNRTYAVEERAVGAVDQVWVCSPHDRETMASLYPSGAPAAVVPNAVAVASYPVAASPTGLTIVYPGVFSYPPNVDAAAFLIERVLPLVTEQVADVRLMLVGHAPTAGMLDAASGDKRVIVTGAVPDVRPYLAEASVMAVPLFAGSGTRLKVLEAFASRLPLVSTAKGVEGLDAEPGRHFAAAESPAEFSEAIVRLREGAERAALVSNGYELVGERYSSDRAADEVRIALVGLLRR